MYEKVMQNVQNFSVSVEKFCRMHKKSDFGVECMSLRISIEKKKSLYQLRVKYHDKNYFLTCAISK